MRSRFLPVDQMDDEVFAPRIVQVAGALPEITVADIMAVGFTPAPEMGMWQYDFSDPEGPQVQTTRRTTQVFNMKEPVAIVCPNDDLNIQMPNDEKARGLWCTTTRLTGPNEWLTCGARRLTRGTARTRDSGPLTSGRQQTPDWRSDSPVVHEPREISRFTSRHHSPPTCLCELPIETNEHYTHRRVRTSQR
ncbi:unnamed protein product [Ectocarpus sp. 12 AP-2014]